MSTSHKQSEFEVKVLAMAHGFSNFPVANAQLIFHKETLTPSQVVQRLQAMVETIQEVRSTEAKHQEAVKACEKAMPGDRAFYEEAVGVVRSHFGSDRKVMATFGLQPHAKHSPPAPIVVIEQVVAPVEVEVEHVEETVAREERPTEESPTGSLEGGGERGREHSDDDCTSGRRGVRGPGRGRPPREGGTGRGSRNGPKRGTSRAPSNGPSRAKPRG